MNNIQASSLFVVMLQPSLLKMSHTFLSTLFLDSDSSGPVSSMVSIVKKYLELA